MATRPRLQRASRPQPEVEQILQDAEPAPEGDVEITLEDDEAGDAEVSITSPPTEREPERSRPAPQDDGAVARALEAQRRAEQLQADAIRQRDEAIRHARTRDAELTRERTDREDAEYNSVLTAIAAEQTALEKSEADYAAAASVGDWATAAKAQRAMAVAGGRLDRLEDGKRTFDTRRETSRVQQPQQPEQQRQAPSFEQQIAALPQPAQAWLRNHPEFINDPAKNRKIQTVHGYLTDNKGVTAFSDAYFEALDQEFGFKQAEPAPQPQRRSIPMTAPVSREVPTAASGTRKQATMRLTEEERKIAREAIPDRPDLPKLTNAQKEYLYAKNKQKYHRMLADGTYDQQRQR